MADTFPYISDLDLIWTMSKEWFRKRKIFLNFTQRLKLTTYQQQFSVEEL